MSKESNLLAQYSSILEKHDGRPLRPLTELPAPLPDMKNALILEGVQAKRKGDSAYLSTIRTCYSYLSKFVAPAVAERNRNLRAMNHEDVTSASTEAQRLVAEFDSIVAALAAEP